MLNRKIYDVEENRNRVDCEKKVLKDEFMMVSGKVLDLEVKFEYEYCEKFFFQVQLEDVNNRLVVNCEEVFKVEQQFIEQKLIVDIFNKDIV